MRTGERQTGMGFPLFGPHRNIPSASSRRMVASTVFGCGNGLMTAIGFPRSVKMTARLDCLNGF